MTLAWALGGCAAVFPEASRQPEEPKQTMRDGKSEPDNDQRLADLGFAAIAGGNLGLAETYLDAALAINPNNPYALLNLGVVYQHTGRRPEARKLYTKLIVIDPPDTAVTATREHQIGTRLVDIARSNLERLEADMALAGLPAPRPEDAERAIVTRFVAPGRLRDEKLITAEERERKAPPVLAAADTPAAQGDEPEPAPPPPVASREAEPAPAEAIARADSAPMPSAPVARETPVEHSRIVADGPVPGAFPPAVPYDAVPPAATAVAAAEAVPAAPVAREMNRHNGPAPAVNGGTGASALAFAARYHSAPATASPVTPMDPAPATSFAALRPAIAPGQTNGIAASMNGAASATHVGQMGVHLSSFRTPQRARRNWNDLRAAHGDALDGLGPRIARIDLGSDKGVFFQLRVGPFADEDAARALCNELKRRSLYCAPTIF
ncbi:MAG: tetratricopeptide repeat protein [Alphaproteobacteria bacterium]